MNDALSWHKLRALAAGPRRIGLLALVALLLTAVFILWSARAVVRAALISPAAPGAIAPAAADRTALATQLQSHADRINGRSLFFIPSPPRREVVEGPRGPDTPPPPSRYGGPALVAMINDAAWFADGTRLRAGDDSKPDVSVKLIALQPPWSARVEWKGVEFTVSLFERSTVLAPPPAASPTAPPAAAGTHPTDAAAAKPDSAAPTSPPEPSNSPPATADAPASPLQTPPADAVAPSNSPRSPADAAPASTPEIR